MKVGTDNVQSPIAYPKLSGAADLRPIVSGQSGPERNAKHRATERTRRGLLPPTPHRLSAAILLFREFTKFNEFCGQTPQLGTLVGRQKRYETDVADQRSPRRGSSADVPPKALARRRAE